LWENEKDDERMHAVRRRFEGDDALLDIVGGAAGLLYTLHQLGGGHLIQVTGGDVHVVLAEEGVHLDAVL
jgi:hypothetical protein